MAGGKNTITQRIALDGGKQIEAELKALGAVGEEAFRRLKNEAAKVEVPTKLQQNLDKLKTSFDGVRKSGEQFGQGLGRVRTAFAGLMGAFATAAKSAAVVTGAVTLTAGALALVVKAAADSGDALSDNAQKAGVAVKQFETLSFAAKTAGVGPEALVGALGKLNKALTTNGDLAQANSRGLGFVKSAADRIAEGFGAAGVTVRRFGQDLTGAKDANVDFNSALKALGTSAVQLKSLDNEQRIIKLADGFAKMEDGAEKTAIALALFGKSGANMVPFLNMGGEGIKKLTDRMKDLGLTVGEDGAKALGELADEMDFLNLGLSVTRDRLVAAFAPDIIRGSNAFLEFLKTNRQAIIDFATTVRDVGVQTFKDFYNAINGNGEAVQNKAILQMVTDIKQFGTDVRAVIDGVILPKIRFFISILDQLAKAINWVFGTNFSGRQLALVGVITKVASAFGLLGPSIGTVINAFKALYNAGKLLGAFFLSNPWALLVVGLLALAAAIYLNWDKIVAYITAAFEFLKSEAARIWGDIKSIFSAETLTAVWEAIKQAGADVWAWISTKASDAWQSIVGLVSSGLDAAWNALKSAGSSVWGAISAAAATAWNTIKQSAADLGSFVSNALTGAIDLIKSAWTAATDFISSSVDKVISSIQSVINSISNAISKAAEFVGLGGGSGGNSGSADAAFASGGYVRGPGTATSDSIRAWLSNGEFVVRAAAVRKYGREFLAALNAGRLKLPAFASGGLVSAPQFKMGLPAFSTGGLVDGLSSVMAGIMPAMPSLAMPDAAMAGSGMVPANIHIGGTTIPVMAQPSALQELARAAGHKKLTSGGVKPSWMK